MRKKYLVAGAVLIVATCADAGDAIYQVSSDLPSGLDLTAQAGCRADALKTPPAGMSCTVTGAVTVDPSVQAGSPFTIYGEGGSLAFVNSGAFSSLAFLFSGAGTTRFDAPRVFGAQDESALRLENGATVYCPSVLVTGTTDAPGTFTFSGGGKIYVDGAVVVGEAGGAGVLSVNGGEMGACENPPATSSTLNVGQSAENTWIPSYGKFVISQANYRTGTIGIGANGPDMPSAEDAAPDNEIYLEGGAILTMWRLRKYRGRTARIVFNGGRIDAPLTYPNGNGWLSSEGRGRLILEGVNGNPIRFVLGYQRAKPMFACYETPDARIMTRGACDFVVDAYNGGASLKPPAAGKIVWNHTGKTIFQGTNIRMDMEGEDVLPFGIQTGPVVLSSATTSVDLKGYSQKVNGLSGSGTVANSGARACLTFGTDHVDGTLSVEAATGALYDVRKVGSGSLTLDVSVPGALTVDAGTVLIPAGEQVLTLDGVSVASGASVSVAGRTLSTSSVAAETAGAIRLSAGACWRFGGADDARIDVSSVQGDSSAVWVKTGEGEVVLSGTSGFKGTIRVEGGRLSFADDALLKNVSKLDVDEGAQVVLSTSALACNRLAVALAGTSQLDVPADEPVSVASLSVAGSAVGEGAMYSGTQIVGGGLYVLERTGLWCGEGGEDITALASWKGVTRIPDLHAGIFLPTFATGGSRALLAGDESLAGVCFDATEGFTLVSQADAALLSIGGQGMTAVGDTSACTYHVDVPVAPTASQTWDVSGSGTVLDVAGLGGDDPEAVVTKTGNGRLVLETTEVSGSAGFCLKEGVVDVYGSGLSGDGGAISLQADIPGTVMRLYGACIEKPVSVVCPDPSAGFGFNYKLVHARSGINVFRKRVDVSGYAVYLSASDQAELVFEGGMAADDCWDPVFLRAEWGDTVFRFRKTPLALKKCLSTNNDSASVEVVFDIGGNAFPDHADGGFRISSPNHRLSLCASDVFAAGSHVWAGSVEMNGFDQKICRFAQSGLPSTCSIHSAQPACLAVTNQTTDLTAACAISGPVGFSKAGSGTMTFSGVAISATGPLDIVSGALILQDATWTGSTNIVIRSAGSLKLTRGDALSRKAVVQLEAGARLVLGESDADFKLRCGELWLDGQRMPTGEYCSHDAPEPLRGVLSGGGRLAVVGLSSGLHIVIR